MSDQPTDLVLVFLRRIDTNVARLRDDMADVRHRLGSVERQVAELRSDLNNLSHRFDRFDLRLERIERRLEIADTAAPA